MMPNHRPSKPVLRIRRLLCLCTALSISITSTAADSGRTEVSGYVDIEYRYFNETAADSRQHDNYLSVGGELEYYREWNRGDDALTLTPYAKVSQRSDNRTHVDFREANWLHMDETWDLRVGLDEVFWGVTESQHLVDIINQTDYLENIDGEDKLGQPMVNLVLLRDWGDLSLFWLPYFREAEFPGREGRLRPHPKVDADYSEYESGAEQKHQDFAVRWSHIVGDLDIAVAHFHGTSRQPTLIATTDDSGNNILAPLYEQIDQTSLELSLVKGDWLWKLEALHRSGQRNLLGESESYNAMVGGFEYTWVGIGGSIMDLGLLLEYHYDDRDRRATTPFQNDTFFGMRLSANDMASSELLLGVIADNGSSGSMTFMEASRRLSPHVKLTVEGRFYHNLADFDPSSGLANDDHLLMNIAYYF